MSLTRKSLKAMGLTDEQIDSVVEMHTDTVNGLKQQIEEAKESKSQLEEYKVELQKYKDDLNKANEAAKQTEDYKTLYETTKKDYEKYKGEISEKAKKAAKEAAVSKYYQSKGINGAALSIAMRASKDEISTVDIDDAGNIKSTEAFDKLIDGDFSHLVNKVQVEGAKVQNPPPDNNKKAITKEEIMNITNRAERQQKIAENPELFGIHVD